MEYYEAVNRLERLRRLRPEMGTESTASLLAHLGDPHEGVTAVQIAGSNGKGSTASVLERILREAGLTVGCYTSPDLNDVRERIRIRGRTIPKREVVRFVEAAWPFVVERSVEGRAPTFFEAFTAMALWHFGREDVDVAVLEVGIGGRYDATSVVDPAAAAVTTVSLEHTDILGSTVEEIARDKAQVAPAGAPLVTGATGRALETIREETDVVTVGREGEHPDTDEVENGNGSRSTPPDVVVAEREGGLPTESVVSAVGPDWEVHTRTPLLGGHQAVNVGIAAALARQVADPGVDALAAGIRNVRWPGRFEVMGTGPLVVLDGAHNPAACRTLSGLLERFDYEDCHLVFGAMRDKDHREMSRALPAADRVYLAEPAVDRAQGTDALAAAFDRETDADLVRCDSVLGALDRALRAADTSDCVLVTGSLYVVGEARDRWTQTPRVVRTDTAARARAAMRDADVPASTRRDRADGMVHRTVRFHARPAGALELRELACSLGATCVVSGLESTDGHVQVVLSGTAEQFTTLLRELRGRTVDAGPLVGPLTAALGIGPDGPAAGSPWSDGTAVAGILRVTPEATRGHGESVDAAVVRAEELVAAGADVVDVGGFARPGDEPIPAETERDRVVPVVDRLAGLEVPVSVETRHPSVAAAALEAGADAVTDPSGLADLEMRRVIAAHGVPAVLVDEHVGAGPDNVVDDVLEGLTERVLLAERAGIDRSRLLVDPGIGRRPRAESVALLDRLEEVRGLGTPVAVSRPPDSTLEAVTGGDPSAGAVAATTLAAARGVDLVRTHDVAATVAAVATVEHTLADR